MRCFRTKYKKLNFFVSRFGDGYTLTIKLLRLDQVGKLKMIMEEVLPEAKVCIGHVES